MRDSVSTGPSASSDAISASSGNSCHVFWPQASPEVLCWLLKRWWCLEMTGLFWFSSDLGPKPSVFRTFGYLWPTHVANSASSAMIMASRGSLPTSNTFVLSWPDRNLVIWQDFLRISAQNFVFFRFGDRFDGRCTWTSSRFVFSLHSLFAAISASASFGLTGSLLTSGLSRLRLRHIWIRMNCIFSDM